MLQEEADTRFLLLAKHAATPQIKAVITLSEHTDVRMQSQFPFIRDAFRNTIPDMFGHQWDIAGVLGQEVSKALLGLHTFTGCDSVNAFAGIRKARPLRFLLSKNEFQVMFQLKTSGKSDLLQTNCASCLSRLCVLYTGWRKAARISISAGMRCFAKKGGANHMNYHLVATAYTITAREPITRTHSQTTKFHVRLARDGLKKVTRAVNSWI